ncbi:hypothetical protein [Rhodosalinus sp. FB01]|uniref:hypothetical protein n=1 Tax=Rhodosalinus sp. FB01 TaxID=3239194 RepID=UPI0035238C25
MTSVVMIYLEDEEDWLSRITETQPRAMTNLLDEQLREEREAREMAEPDREDGR